MVYNIPILFSFYFLAVISVLGYGIFFNQFLLKKNNFLDIGFQGLLGVFFLIIYSLIKKL